MLFKQITFILIFLMCSSFVRAQEDSKIDTIHKKIFSLHDYYGHAAAITQSNLMVIGGSIKSESTEVYIEDKVNERIILMDWDTDRAIIVSLDIFPVKIKEVLGSTGMQYYQDEDLLYIIGGYGYSADCQCFKTMPSLVVLEISNVISALQSAQNPKPFIRYLEDDRLAVMDGFLEKSADTFFLLEGQKCYKLEAKEDEAFYFVEQFDNQVRSFKVSDDGAKLDLMEYQVWTDLDAFYEHFKDLIPGTFLGSGEYRFKMERHY